MTIPVDSDVEALKIAQQLTEYHHNALWEEQKHFTWLLSITLGAQFTFITFIVSQHINIWWIVFVLAIVGLLFSIIALCVSRRESEFFVTAQKRFSKHINKVFPDDPIPDNSDNIKGKKLPIRVYFQIVFGIFIIANIFQIISSILNWISWT
jgi:Ca2+/Na+ antiporter